MGANFAASTTALASSAVLTWGTTIPPTSSVRYITPGRFKLTRTKDVMPHRSHALVRSGTSAKSLGPCSPSIQYASKPSGPMKSIILGESWPDTTVTTSPRSSFAVFSLILANTRLLCPTGRTHVRPDGDPARNRPHLGHPPHESETMVGTWSGGWPTL